VEIVETVRFALKDDGTEDDVFIFGSVQVLSQFVRCTPKGLFEKLLVPFFFGCFSHRVKYPMLPNTMALNDLCNILYVAGYLPKST